MSKRADEEHDRTILGDRWASAVAEVDDLRELLAGAEKAEAEAWAALEKSRAVTVAAPARRAGRKG